MTSLYRKGCSLWAMPPKKSALKLTINVLAATAEPTTQLGSCIANPFSGRQSIRERCDLGSSNQIQLLLLSTSNKVFHNKINMAVLREMKFVIGECSLYLIQGRASEAPPCLIKWLTTAHHAMTHSTLISSLMTTWLERVCNSRYGNGVPATFIS